jgi:hypothetical protein
MSTEIGALPKGKKELSEKEKLRLYRDLFTALHLFLQASFPGPESAQDPCGICKKQTFYSSAE